MRHLFILLGITILSLFIILYGEIDKISAYGKLTKLNTQVNSLFGYFEVAKKSGKDPRDYSTSTEYFNELGIGVWSNMSSGTFSINGYEDDCDEAWTILVPELNDFCVIVSWPTNTWSNSNFEVVYITDNLRSNNPKEFWETHDHSTLFDFSELNGVGVVSKYGARSYIAERVFEGLRNCPYDSHHLVLRP